MSSVTEIETEIQKLSMAKQRIIALHLGERLLNQERPAACAAADEGIRFLPRCEFGETPGASRGRKLRQPAHAAR